VRRHFRVDSVGCFLGEDTFCFVFFGGKRHFCVDSVGFLFSGKLSSRFCCLFFGVGRHFRVDSVSRFRVGRHFRVDSVGCFCWALEDTFV
jgi:hypothetical protein